MHVDKREGAVKNVQHVAPFSMATFPSPIV